MHLRLLVTCLLLLLSCRLSQGSSLYLESSSGFYQYGLILDAGSTFTNADTITLTGLSGVDGAAVTNPSLATQFMATSTSTSVTVFAFGLPFMLSGDFTNFLAVDSTSPASGEVSYAINASTTSSGMVEGPVAVNTIPEPSSLALLVTGVLGLAGVIRRRLA
jgi:hypothetical protein